MTTTAHLDTPFAARCLLRAARWAALATARDGQPFAGLVTHAVAPDGAVLMLLSAMAEHTQQLLADARCALMVTGAPEAGNENWQTAPRLTVSGIAERSADRGLRASWLARHPFAHLYADFTDFSLWRLVPAQALFVAGFGRIARLDGPALAPDSQAVAALAAVEADLLSHCNTSHHESLSRLAHASGASGQWRMVGVDTDGIDLAQDETVMRVAFDAPVCDAAGVEAAVQRLAKAGWRGFW